MTAPRDTRTRARRRSPLPSPVPTRTSAAGPNRAIETFPNPHPTRDYEIEFTCPEFTCLCPKTGQPDFATFTISYVPDRACVELKSLKLYLWSFRDQGHFHEAVTNRSLVDLGGATPPRRMTIVGEFFVRGGIRTVVRVEHPASPPAPRQLR